MKNKYIVILNFTTKKVDIVPYKMEELGYTDIEEYLSNELDYSLENIQYMVTNKINLK